jgi:hypothetical protein
VIGSQHEYRHHAGLRSNQKNPIQESDLKEQLKQIKDRLGEHDTQLNQIYDALENLLDEKVAQQKWEERIKIGFRS